jgi:hypothetical protein
MSGTKKVPDTKRKSAKRKSEAGSVLMPYRDL